jgi:hypothetical protein
VRGVHVHHHQPIGVFRQDIATVQLAQRVAQRRSLGMRRRAPDQPEPVRDPEDASDRSFRQPFVHFQRQPAGGYKTLR